MGFRSAACFLWKNQKRDDCPLGWGSVAKENQKHDDIWKITIGWRSVVNSSSWFWIFKFQACLEEFQCLVAVWSWASQGIRSNSRCRKLGGRTCSCAAKPCGCHSNAPMGSFRWLHRRYSPHNRMSTYGPSWMLNCSIWFSIWGRVRC